MDIFVGRTSVLNDYPSSTSGGNLLDSQRVTSSDDVKQETSEEQVKLGAKKEEDPTKDEVHKVADGLNKFLEYLEADLQFEIHEETERMMVKVVSRKDQKVIKEIPPRELLDTGIN